MRIGKLEATGMKFVLEKLDNRIVRIESKLDDRNGF